MSPPPRHVLAWLHKQDDATLRATLAVVAGLLAHKEGGYAPTTTRALTNISDRLAGRPMTGQPPAQTQQGAASA